MSLDIVRLLKSVDSGGNCFRPSGACRFWGCCFSQDLRPGLLSVVPYGTADGRSVWDRLSSRSQTGWKACPTLAYVGTCR